MHHGNLGILRKEFLEFLGEFAFVKHIILCIDCVSI